MSDPARQQRPGTPSAGAGADPIRALVVDDEPAARDAIRGLLADEPAILVVGEARNGEEAVALIRRLRPDLLFLDVQMPDRDGFGVLAALGADVPRGVIFVTAHDEHAIRAFEVHALDYLLKPFGRPRFEAAVGRALERLAAQDALGLQRTLAAIDARGAEGPPAELATAAAEPRPRRLAVRTGTRVVLVDPDRIDWVEAEGDYARLHVGERAHLLSARLNEVEAMLPAAAFLRIHRSIVVNLERVLELHRESDGGGTVVLQDGIRLRVARTRRAELERALGLGPVD